jgi:hypothetical protein
MPPHPLVHARSTPFLCQMPRSRYEDLPPGRASHAQFARLRGAKLIVTGLVPHFCSNPAHGQNHQSNQGRDSAATRPARALLAGETNASKVGKPGTRKKSAATGRYRASGRMPRGSTHVI